MKAYSGLDTDNAYVNLQKAYFSAECRQMTEAGRFWEISVKNCPAGFEAQLVRMGVNNGFPVEILLNKMSLEDWDTCGRILSEHIIPADMKEFYEKILKLLEKRPLFAERLKQVFLEKKLTQGMLEPLYMTELLWDYCESVIADARMLYRREILDSRDSYMQPEKYKFAVRMSGALRLIDDGKIAECVPLLAEAVHIFPQMSGAVSHLTRYLNEIIKNPPPHVSEEFLSLGGQVKQMLFNLMNNKKWDEAYGVSTQLVTLLPEDMEVLRLKQEILRAGTG